MLPFDFVAPPTLLEALSLLDEQGEDACIFGGGTALVIALRQRMIAPRLLVSMVKLPELRGITYDPAQGLRIGAMTRHIEIATSPLVRTQYPVLADMFGRLANPQVRTQGTVGGNLCYADPATDPPACLLALGAEVAIAGPMGERRVPLRAFLTDYFTTALEPGEILLGLRLPAADPGRRAFYRRHLRTPAAHRPVANVALVMTPGDDGHWRDVRLSVGAAIPVARRMAQAEAALTGCRITLDTARDVAEIVAADLDPISDERGEAGFRTTAVRANVRRIIAEAAGLDWAAAA